MIVGISVLFHLSTLDREVFGADAGVPIDPAKLQVIQRTLQGYLSRIETVHLVYTTSVFDTLKGSADATITRSRTELSLNIVNDHYRSKNTSEISRGKADLGNESESAYDGVQRIGLSHRAKTANVATTDKPRGAGHNMILHTLGLPVLSTRHTPLYNLLKFPELTTDCGMEELHGQPVIVLQLGPGLPSSLIEGHDLWKDARVKLWLAVDSQYIPMRTEIYMKVPKDMGPTFYKDHGVSFIQAADASGAIVNYYRIFCEIEEVRQVIDHARKEQVPFPWRIKNVSGGTLNIICEQVELNPSLSPNIFSLSIPADYSVVKDREVVRAHIQTMPKSKTNKVVSVAETGRQAREMLSMPIPDSPTHSGNTTGWVWLMCGVCGVIAGVAVFCLRSRGNV